MRLIAVALIAIVMVTARPGPRWHQLQGYTFERYVADFNKDYAAGSPEWNHRRGVFEGRLADIMAHNGDATSTFKMGVNQFTDTTDEERRRYNRGVRVSPKEAPGNGIVDLPSDSEPLPEVVDYRKKVDPVVLTAVKSQGVCGDCWATAVTQSVETYYALLTGELHLLSQQQITSCTNMTDCWTWRGRPMGGGGCTPGAPQRAIENIQQQGGLHRLWVYPYVDFFVNETTPVSPCRNFSGVVGSSQGHVRPVATTAGYKYVGANNATKAMRALAHIGPFVTFVAAWAWFDYESGVFQQNASYGNLNYYTDHVVQVVGYGHDAGLGGGGGVDYWIVRNTFGARWGEAGYIRLERLATEPCGTDNDAFSCGVDVNKTVPVCGTTGVLSQPLFPLVAEIVN